MGFAQNSNNKILRLLPAAAAAAAVSTIHPRSRARSVLEKCASRLRIIVRRSFCPHRHRTQRIQQYQLVFFFVFFLLETLHATDAHMLSTVRPFSDGPDSPLTNPDGLCEYVEGVGVKTPVERKKVSQRQRAYPNGRKHRNRSTVVWSVHTFRMERGKRETVQPPNATNGPHNTPHTDVHAMRKTVNDGK